MKTGLQDRIFLYIINRGMKILIACHCMGRPALTFTSNIIDSSEVEISYIDKSPNCTEYGKPLQYFLWKDLPNNSFDYIWFMYCPIWGQMKNTGKASEWALKIFNAALKKVKSGGEIIINPSIEGEVPDIYFKSIHDKVENKFTYELKEKKDLPFLMESTRKGDNCFKKLFVLTKTGPGGGAGKSAGGYRRRRIGKTLRRQAPRGSCSTVCALRGRRQSAKKNRRNTIKLAF